MSLSECSHCHYKNASSEVYCRQCQRPMHQATGRAGEIVVTSRFPRHPPEKRVKIWFDDEGEPHETLVDPEPEIPEPVAVGSVAIGQRQVQVWFDEEGEPHEGPMGGAPTPTRVEPRPKPVWYDDNGMPHATREAAAAANTRPDTDRTTVSPPPQTHSAFTQGLTPKPIYFERVDTARDEPLPRQAHGQTVLRPSTQTPAARATEQPARTLAPATPHSTSAVPHNPVQARTPGPMPTTQRQGLGAHAPNARSTAGNLGTPVPQRAPSPTASPAARTAQSTAQAGAQGATGRSSSSTLGPAAARAQHGPPRSSGTLGATPAAVRTAAAPIAEPAAKSLFSDNIITDEHTVATADLRPEEPEERTVGTPMPAQARESQTTSSSSLPPRTVAPSSSLASNYRAAAAHAALVDGAAKRPARAETPERRTVAQAPLIGIDLPAGSGAHTGTAPSRAVSTHTPFALLTDERTVTTPPPSTPAVLASTLAPVAGRATVAPLGPAAQRPTLTHTPVPMEDRSNPLAARPAGGGFFNRGAEAPSPVVPPRESSSTRPEVSLTASTPAAGGGFFHRPDPTAIGRPAELPVPTPTRRLTGITDPSDANPVPALPAPTAPLPLANSLEARLTTNRDAVHDQATVVRDSPFLQSEPTVVRGPGVSDEEEEPPTRRRLTEPLLARSTGFVAPIDQAIQTERASLWRLAAAALIDGLLTVGVGLSTAAAEMLLFGGHWPTETTNPLDAFAMWMHNYPGTQKRALLIMLLFAWGYAALGARRGRTLGRTLLCLMALQQDGDMMTWPRAAWRSSVGLFSVLFFGAGYFWAIVDRQHRALHDVLSRSIVVSRKSS